MILMTDMHHDLTHAFRRARWGLILRGLLALAFGIFALFRPLQTVAILALVVAFWATFSGIVMIVNAFDLRDTAKHWWLMLAAGVISVVFGAAAFVMFPTLSLAFLVLWTVWWLLSGGVLEISTSIQEKRAGWPWAWHMIFGVLLLLASAFALLNPPATLAALTIWLGIAALVIGGMLLAVAVSTRKIERRAMGEARSDREMPRAA
jgi:uncharacterized membrane protein HdeD (DUF308 family)